MALTSSGQIAMSEINTELGRTSTTANTSLEDQSDGTYATINTANNSADRPDGSAPHAMTEFYSYDHDLSSTSWSTSNNTNLHLNGDPGTTDVSNSDAEMTVTGGSGGTSCSVTTTGGPFGTFTLAVGTTGDPGTGGTSNGGFAAGFVSTTTANSDSRFSSHNSGTRYIRTRWSHSPSNKDGTGAYTLTLTNNGVSATVTCNIDFSALGGLCIYENIPVNLQDWTAIIHDLPGFNIIMSCKWSTPQQAEVALPPLPTTLPENLSSLLFSHPNDGTDGEELKELILTSDHPIYKQDGNMVSQDPGLSKSNYDLDATEVQPNDLLKMLNGKYYASVHRLEGFPKKHWTYTIKTKNNNFYANGVLVNSEIS